MDFSFRAAQRLLDPFSLEISVFSLWDISIGSFLLNTLSVLFLEFLLGIETSTSIHHGS